MKSWKHYLGLTVVSSALLLGACGGNVEEDTAEDGATEEQAAESDTASESADQSSEAAVEGEVSGDGSSTVAPIMEALVEEYSATGTDVQVTVGVSGTGGGFEKFIAGETDFSNASREIKDEEKQKLEEAGIDYTEFLLAYDGLTVVVNPENDWATELTVEDLKKIWVEDGTTKKWSDINPEWPDEEIVFYSPGTDSGTYDYFNEVILEEEDMVRNATLSEDDNVLVQGVQGDKNAIGFFGYSYYVANQDTIQAVAIDGVEPTNETIESGDYSPLSRPLYTYVSNEALQNDAATYDFFEFALDNAGAMAEAVGYVSLPQEVTDEQKAKLEEFKK
ncbi:PstS family phosphate ABC transporter substrate-binding protein [Bhargavaea beijingensis]|uniref:PstS family phosphate ABC transporter substrate-binding protein n=1 Tax=Bhargavaea beijingensis TaxID=426756 RepID=UPI0022250BA0|nr:PstS family phosphate ABC transporter substrate-binding protein [Bhargavaea beijingensis]MCW1929026.1 PstS family phosphate ABC transporter substrate-binding protein [Bhargavaea beijingensis]